jgi:hypothetical protein
MDITTDYMLTQIKKLPIKHWRSRKFQKNLNEQISGLRVTAYKMKGTFTGQFCSSEANRLEKELSYILKGKNR